MSDPVSVLRKRRIELGVGLRFMARQLGISPSHLSDIERGKKSPGDELLARMLARYGVTMSEAFEPAPVRRVYRARMEGE